MYSGFVPANRLYDVESRTPIAHPVHTLDFGSEDGTGNAPELQDDRSFCPE